MRTARLRARRDAALGKAADLLGAVARVATRTIPGAGGALLVCYGLGEIYQPLLFISGGAFLLVLHREMPD